MQRLTFREKQSGKAWQRIIRERAAENYVGKEWWSGVDLSLKSAMVRPVDRKTAKKIILEYEWLGTLPITTVRFSGLFFDWACGGVCCISDHSAGAKGSVEFGVHRQYVSYLARGACAYWTPPGSGSKLIAHTLRREASLGKSIVMAYSDTDAGEIGTLYQATNWLCLGRGVKMKELVHPKTGRVYNQTLTHRIRLGSLGKYSRPDAMKFLLDRGWREQDSNPKWRYVYILAKGKERNDILKRIEKRIVPYPKRAPVEGLSDQERIGGSNPTRTLQTGGVT